MYIDFLDLFITEDYNASITTEILEKRLDMRHAGVATVGASAGARGVAGLAGVARHAPLVGAATPGGRLGVADLAGVDDLGAVAAGHTTSDAVQVATEVGGRALASAGGGGGLASGGASTTGVVAGITASTADLVASRVPGGETTAALIDHSVALDEDVGLDVSSVGDGLAGGVLATTAAGILVSEVDADTAILAGSGAGMSARHVTVSRSVVLMLGLEIRVGVRVLVLDLHLTGFLVLEIFISLQFLRDDVKGLSGIDNLHVFGMHHFAIVLVDTIGIIGVLAVR
jgi:hypothetical protein